MTKKILIIEDEDDMRALLSLSLAMSGYQVFVASDGPEGMDETAEIVPHLIILDLMLPTVGGYEVCARLKSDQRFSKIPILVFTARASEVDRFMSLQCGADDYLPKPFDEDILLEKVQHLLDGHSNAQLN
jgi:DNA-binding response OmpR family regulator